MLEKRNKDLSIEVEKLKEKVSEMTVDEYRMLLSKLNNKIKEYKQLKEQKFCCLFNANELGFSNDTEQILVQGQIDLLAVNGSDAILIDFKYSTIKNDSDLIKNYYTQLKLYKEAIEKSSKYKVKEVYLVNILQLKSVKVDV